MKGTVACIAVSIWGLGGAPGAQGQATVDVAWPEGRIAQQRLATVEPLLAEPG